MRKEQRKRYYILFCMITIATWACAQQVKSIHHLLDSAYHAAPFSANILITKKGKTVFEKSYGYADYPKQKPLTKHHSFQVASISKQFTAYGIMLLNNACKLSYDSLVKKYLPEFPYANITVRHLLHHTSGLPDFWDDIRPNLDTMRSNGNRDVLSYLAAHSLPLQFEPGSRFAYCDIGYDFLANIIEKLSGKSYLEFLNEQIFVPLKMKDTYAYMVTDIARINNKNLAPGHAFDTVTRKFVYAHLLPEYHFVFYLGDFYGDGSLVTTAKDLSAWTNALKACMLMPCELQNPALDPAVYNGQTVFVRNDIAYGFGWYIRRHPQLGRMLYHGGSHPGNMHYICRLPDHDITFIFLSNTETEDHVRLRNRIISLLQ